MRIYKLKWIQMIILITIISSSLYIISTIHADAIGQCYTGKPVYQFNEVVIIVINTPTGINNTQIMIYLPSGQINTYNIGKIGSGVWQFPLGSAGHPEGVRTVILMDGSQTLFSTHYTVTAPSSLTTQTTYQTTIQHQTTTLVSTITEFFTETTLKTDTSTVVSTVKLPPPKDTIYFLLIIIIALLAVIIILAIRIRRAL